MDFLIANLCPVVDVKLGPGIAPIEATVYSVTLCIRASDSVHLMSGQWDLTMPQLRRAFARYRNSLTKINIVLTTAQPMRVNTETVGTIKTGPVTVGVNVLVDKSGSRYIRTIITNVPVAVAPSSPTDLCDAIRKNDIETVKTIVASGVDINSETGVCPVMKTAVRANAVVREWFITHPDIRWDQRFDYLRVGCPMAHLMVTLKTEELHRLPWNKIDPHQQDSSGNNMLHAYITSRMNVPILSDFTGRIRTDGMTESITLLIRYGSGTLALGINNELMMPSSIIGRGQRQNAGAWSSVVRDVIPLIQRVERETAHTLKNLLQCHIPADLVDIITAYYTFCVPLKRKRGNHTLQHASLEDRDGTLSVQ
jgi:hypothetical protein